MSRISSSFFFSLALILSASANAYVGSVSSGTAQAGRAAIEASETPFGNPASLAYLRGYYFTAGFGSAHQSTNGRTQDLAVGLIENMKTTVVPTALSYSQASNRPEGATEDVYGKSFKLSFGNFVRPGFAFGLAINHENTKISDVQHSQTNLQTGFLWAPNKDFGAALVLDNLIPPSVDVPEIYRLKQTIALGTSYNFKRFVRFKGDLISASNQTFGKPTLALGMESYMNRWMILRWGVQRNNEQAAYLYTGGLGFIGPKFGLHYAYENSPQNESLTRHSVDLAVPIW